MSEFFADGDMPRSVNSRHCRCKPTVWIAIAALGSNGLVTWYAYCYRLPELECLCKFVCLTAVIGFNIRQYTVAGFDPRFQTLQLGRVMSMPLQTLMQLAVLYRRQLIVHGCPTHLEPDRGMAAGCNRQPRRRHRHRRRQCRRQLHPGQLQT